MYSKRSKSSTQKVFGKKKLLFLRKKKKPNPKPVKLSLLHLTKKLRKTCGTYSTGQRYEQTNRQTNNYIFPEIELVEVIINVPKICNDTLLCYS